MDPNNHNDQLDEFNKTSSRGSAVKLIQERIKSLYPKHQTDQPTSRPKESLVQRFWQEHKDHPNPEHAWQRFYEGLQPHQKQQLWDEYHTVQSGRIPAAQQGNVTQTAPENSSPSTTKPSGLETQTAQQASNTQHSNGGSVADLKQDLLNRVKRSKPSRDRRLPDTSLRSHLKPFIMAMGVAFIVMGMNYNQLVIAQIKQYVRPSELAGTPVIVDPNSDIKVGKEPRIIIPKINVDVPVVYDVKTYQESAIQNALERGVVHYGNTPVPGEPGNNIIVGHSSNNFFNAGKYKFAFVLLNELELGDTFTLHYEGTRYVYKVSRKEVTSPDTSDPLTKSLLSATQKPTTTLITCTPPGTSWKRLIVQGQQISPSPTKKTPKKQDVAEEAQQQSQIIPGTSETLWDRLSDWLFGDD